MKHYRLDRAERFLVSLIQGPEGARGHGRAVRLLLWVLRQFARIYGLAVQLRILLYEQRLCRPHTLGCQVISVGNLTVGGTGKTPVVEVFARELQREGRQVAILSRGYKKEEPPFLEKLWNRVSWRESRQPPRVVSDGKELLLDSAMSGDEPYMLASNLPEVAVLVDKDRVKSGRFAINRLGCDTLILDDGFQYLALRHTVEIVLVDRTNPFGNEHVLPRGILREPIRNIKRADFVFLTKSDGKGSEPLRERIRALNPRAEIIECCHKARHLKHVYSGEQRALSWLSGLRVTAMSGIAAPEGFERELESHGARIVQRHRFADHHRYSQQEVINIVNSSRKTGVRAIITTEKDAVRFPKLDRCDVPIYFIRVDIEILSGVEDFRACIARICFRETRAAA